MNVLITGASGYIGRYLVEELIKHGHKIKALTRKQSLKIKGTETIYGDITKPESFINKLDGLDSLIHNAAYAMDWGKKNDIYRINIGGTKNIAETCKTKEIFKIIYTSSAGIYGFPNNENIISENSPINPFNIYHKSKLEGEKIFKKYEDFNISIVRPPLVLGGGGKAEKIILDKIEQKKMRYIGNGNQCISIVHPKDVAQCLRLALENDTNDSIFNVVSFICTIKQLFEEIAYQLGIEPPRKHIQYNHAYVAAFFSELFSIKQPSITRFRVRSFGTTRKISCKRAKEELGYIPKYDLQTTVEDIVSMFKK